MNANNLPVFENFVDAPRQNSFLKYFAILPLALCFVTVYSNNILTRSFLSDIEHNRVYEIITYLQTARRQASNNIFVVVLLRIKKLNDSSPSPSTMGIKSSLFCML